MHDVLSFFVYNYVVSTPSIIDMKDLARTWRGLFSIYILSLGQAALADPVLAIFIKLEAYLIYTSKMKPR